MKIVFWVLVIAAIIYFVFWRVDFYPEAQPKWGVAFSEYYASEILGLDARETYLAILHDLNPRSLRLIAYWQYLEPKRGEFNFENLDFQIAEAGKLGKDVVLVIGERVPRWPECHAPAWINELSGKEKEKAFFGYLEKAVGHYKEFQNIKIWQVENEPLLSVFGACPKPDVDLLKKEIGLVKSLDSRPVMVTDSGELSFWFRAPRLGDVFGTTLYKIVWNKYTGWFKHFYPPVFYTLRGELAKITTKTNKIVISELQAEPWTPDRKIITDIAFEEQSRHFDLNQLEENIAFAKKTGIDEIYLWGSEWWYYRKIHGDDSYWQFVKAIIKNNPVN